jgi:lipoyl(octanoyl) transferase
MGANVDDFAQAIAAVVARMRPTSTPRHGNARIERRQLPFADLHRARHLAGPARCPVPRTDCASDGQGGAVSAPLLRELGRVDYAPTFAAMQEFTATRGAETPDELWLCEHPPVFTQGLSGKPRTPAGRHRHPRGADRPWWPDHLPRPRPGGDLPAARPAPARLLGARPGASHRAGGDRPAGGYEVTAERREGAPGVYVGAAKIAALGLRIKHGCSYHGVSLNIDMDLSPYDAINPCGYAGMAVTQLSACSPQWRAGLETAIVGRQLAAHLARQIETSDT